MPFRSKGLTQGRRKSFSGPTNGESRDKLLKRKRSSNGRQNGNSLLQFYGFQGAMAVTNSDSTNRALGAMDALNIDQNPSQLSSCTSQRNST